MLIGVALLSVWFGQGLLLAPSVLALGGMLVLALSVALSLGLVTSGQAGLSSRPAPRLLTDLFVRIRSRPGGYGLLAASLVVSGLAFGLAALPETSGWPALLAWAAGIALFLAAGHRLDLGRVADVEVAETIAYARWEWAALLALTLAALALRAWNIAGVPANFGGDEGEMGMVARSVLSGEATEPFVTGWLSHPMLWFYLQAGALLVFGNNVAGLRMLSALLGTAAVPMLYVFARPLYGRSVALAAAALLAVYHFHIHFSRLGVNNIADPLLALAAFAAFFHGYRRASLAGFALAGVLLGLGMHFYMGARLAPLIVMGVLAHQLVFDRARLMRLRHHILMMVAGYLVGFGPLLSFFIAHPEDFTARLAVVGVFQSGWFEEQVSAGESPLALLVGQLYNGFGAYTFLPDQGAWYDPLMPLLDPVSAALFFLGLALAVVRIRRPGPALLLGWVAGASLFGGVLIVNLESPRFVTTAPALCLLVALGLQQIGSLAGWALRRRPAARWAVVAVGVAALAAWNFSFYFWEYTPRRIYGWLNTEVATAIGVYARDLPGDTFVYLFGPPRIYLGNGTISFLAPAMRGEDVDEPIASPDDLPPLPDGARPVFIFLPERLGELDIVQQRYPGGEMLSYYSRELGEDLLTIYLLPGSRDLAPSR